MSKLGDYDDSKLPQNQRDLNDDVRRVINFGKYQIPVVGAPPSWTARKGEFVAVFATSGTIMMCTTDNSTTWRSVVSFPL